jgi:hypothetical protein
MLNIRGIIIDPASTPGGTRGTDVYELSTRDGQPPLSYSSRKTAVRTGTGFDPLSSDTFFDGDDVEVQRSQISRGRDVGFDDWQESRKRPDQTFDEKDSPALPESKLPL